MLHIPVLIRKTTATIVLLVAIGIVEYFIIAQIHTQLGDHNSRREAARLAQMIAEDIDRDPNSQVVGLYSKKTPGKGRNGGKSDHLGAEVLLKIGGDNKVFGPHKGELDPSEKPDNQGEKIRSPGRRQRGDKKLKSTDSERGQNGNKVDASEDGIRPNLVSLHNSEALRMTRQDDKQDREIETKEAMSEQLDDEDNRVLILSNIAQEHQKNKTDSDSNFLRMLLRAYIEEEQRRQAAGQSHDVIGNFTIDYNNIEILETDTGFRIVRRHLPLDPEVLVENDTRPYRDLSPLEEEGANIMFTLRTMVASHQKRLLLLMETWMTRVDCGNIFIVTDGPDPEIEMKAKAMGMHYSIATCDKTNIRNESNICCKEGHEFDLMFRRENRQYDWLCHIDDDIYINLKPLVKLLSKFDPKKEPVYIGRAGSDWRRPRRVLSGAKLGKTGQTFHFAVGGMHCLNRVLLQEAKPYLVGGRNFARSCSKTLEPDDVTIGFIVGAVLNHSLSRTELINTHGLHLASYVDSNNLQNQVAISYGFGSVKWGYDDYNAIYVPYALFGIDEDESQFRSLHCHLFPDTDWCVERKKHVEIYGEQNQAYSR